MTSGPYQSSLLRFAINQYRRGINRHQVAVRTAQSKAVTAVAVGLAISLLPVSATLSVSRWVRHCVGRSLKQKRLPGVTAKVAKLLNFTDFDETPLVKPELVTPLMVEAVRQREAEWAIAQTLLSVGSCLSTAQIKLLSVPVKSEPGGLLKRVSGFIDRFWQSAEVAASAQVTGFASDLETRSLVLVLGHITVWNGLSADQQRQLHQQISLFCEGLCWQSNGVVTAISSVGCLAVRKARKTNLLRRVGAIALPIRSFWVEVLRAIAELNHQPRIKPMAQLSGGLPKISGTASAPDMLLYSLNPTTRSLQPTATTLCHSSSRLNIAGKEELKKEADARTIDWEANVIATNYIEHPLEKLLKWVDRLLVRIEAQLLKIKRLLPHL